MFITNEDGKILTFKIDNDYGTSLGYEYTYDENGNILTRSHLHDVACI